MPLPRTSGPQATEAIESCQTAPGPGCLLSLALKGIESWTRRDFSAELNVSITLQPDTVTA